MLIEQTEDVMQEACVKLCIYGPSGVGKTMLAATAPRPLILSAESGLLSLRKANIERVFGVDTPGISYNVGFITCKTMDKLREVYQWLTESPDALAYDTIILDSVTDIAEVVLAAAKLTAKDGRAAYGKMAEDMMVILRSFRDIPNFNVVFLAKLDKVKDELTGGIAFGPMMPGQQLSKQLPYLFDEVLALELSPTTEGKAERYLRCRKDWQYDIKDRSGVLDMYEYPSLFHLFAKLKT